ncbi:IS30 family transposase [Weissella confusa]|uniref:IS30 family transposase n=1 Tax=Weissella confusa TaxID=1583 RepID=UPI001C6FBD6F|nr:IS30 family transposase [Weissella confusa]QYU58829.1 IS30 family transposase [Weissella confusa]
MAEKPNKRKIKSRKRLTEQERYQIEYMWNQEQLTQVEIANRIGITQSSLSRELQRGNTIDLSNFDRRTLSALDSHARIQYSAQRAQYIVMKNRTKLTGRTRLNDDVKEMIEHWINVEHWTADQIVAANVLDIEVSAETIRSWARKGLINVRQHRHRRSLTPKEQVIAETQRARQREIHRLREELKLKGVLVRHSIYDRSELANSRKQFGHWEIDLVMPAKMNNNKYLDTSAIMTFTERKTRYTALVLVPSKQAADVVAAFDVFWQRYGQAVRSITADNGSEFISFEFMRHVQKDLKVKLYYATPSAPQQRGSNENRNRKLREFYPKGTTFKDLKQAQLDAVADKMNNMPLTQALNGNQPIKLFTKEYNKMQRYRRAYEKRKQKMLEKKLAQDNTLDDAR